MSNIEDGSASEFDNIGSRNVNILPELIQSQKFPSAFSLLKKDPLTVISFEDSVVLLNNLDKLIENTETSDPQILMRENAEACALLYKRLQRQKVLRGFGSITSETYPVKLADVTPLKLEQTTGMSMQALTARERPAYWRNAGIGT